MKGGEVVGKDLINSLIQSNSKEVSHNDTNNIKVAKGVVFNVDSDYSHASVQLTGNNKTIVKLLNKTGEKLQIGDGVRIFYSTDISCGWIAVRNNNPSPLVTNLEIDSAAIIPTSAEKQYLTDTEIFNIDVKNQIKISYGNHRNRIIVGGYLMPVCYDMPEIYGDTHMEAELTLPKDVWNEYKQEQLITNMRFRDLDDEHKQFFNENIDCVLPNYDFRTPAYLQLKTISLCSITYKNVTYKKVRTEIRVSITSQNNGNDWFICPEIPYTFGVMPVVRTSGARVQVKLYFVSYDQSNHITSACSFIGGGGYSRFDYGNFSYDLTDDEYNYMLNIQSKAEVKPSDNG